MEIRKMHIDDYDDVYELWLKSEGMGLYETDDSKEGINRFLNRNPDTCFVATDGNKVVGSILAGNDGRRGYIYHAAVKKEYRRQGIAANLVETAVDALKKCGISKTALVVFAKNKNGNGFWEKMGFGVRGDLLYRDKSLTTMSKINK